jgi:hypothetical protein
VAVCRATVAMPAEVVKETSKPRSFSVRGVRIVATSAGMGAKDGLRTHWVRLRVVVLVGRASEEES